jgi:hypothetical protein
MDLARGVDVWILGEVGLRTREDSSTPVTIIIGVSTFSGDLPDLSFDDDPLGCLQGALHLCEHRVELVRDPDADAMKQHLRVAEAGEVDVVHVLSHGAWSKGTNRLRVAAAGAGGRADRDRWIDVRSWLSDVVDADVSRPLLVSLDVCSAGAAAYEWLDRADRPVWLLGAAEAGERAYRARFTRALTVVLNRIAAGDSLGTSPDQEFISLEVLSTEIWRELDRLIRDEGSRGLPQNLITSRHALPARSVPPLFRNRDFLDDPVRRARRLLDRALSAALSGLDDVLGAVHFQSRALGGTPSLPPRRCCFAGRTEQLQHLAGWLERPAAPGSSLRVVTGSPGTGKSALLGVLVCLGHPDLAPLAQLLDRLPAKVKPRRVRSASMAAVHARNRDVTGLLASIGRQLGIAASGVDIGGLLTGLEDRDDQPVIVLDALDEANDPAAVHRSVLVPLATARTDRGDPICRLLVGTRDDARFGTLLGLARGHAGGYLDLDADHEQTLGDVADYVQELLDLACDQGPWADVGRDIVAALATGIAQTVTPRAGRVEVGPFLLAQLYTHHLILKPPPADTATAARRAGKAPRRITELLRLELHGPDTPQWLRPLLVAWAHALGSGMPLALARAVAVRLAAVHTAPRTEPTPEQLHAAMDRATFYLRTDTDTNGTALYALFHRSLQDHLTTHPFAEPEGAP